MSWRTVLGLVLLAAAIVSGWSAWRMRDRGAAPVEAGQRSDYVLRDFEMVTLSREGTESVRLKAPELQRSREDESLAITEPVFLVPAHEGMWRLSADRGWVAPGGDLARLEGNVAGDGEGDNPSQVSLRTGWLELLPDTHQARTGDRVTLTQPGIIQTGVGMEADLRNRNYRLLSQVKVRYELSKR
ncbi:LPS export ABC transporter periplasmic protein LptC [Pseudoxanthomonas sp. J35]|uniref:LPS export ABC transporter periplasmic protein LptC n=1 Tax=Pseudoxanthomonas sp. J35 TaxID=935852 RepID=UPI00048BF3C1|nr:LPS export ABC transporter periplasmic protein LptC [Pseudoxanthomonas sp. J35]